MYGFVLRGVLGEGVLARIGSGELDVGVLKGLEARAGRQAATRVACGHLM